MTQRLHTRRHGMINPKNTRFWWSEDRTCFAYRYDRTLWIAFDCSSDDSDDIELGGASTLRDIATVIAAHIADRDTHVTRWRVERNRHGHLGSSHSFVPVSNTSTSDKSAALAKADKLRQSHDRIQWHAGRAPITAYDYRVVELDMTSINRTALADIFTRPAR